jgi:hypothetical protein
MARLTQKQWIERKLFNGRYSQQQAWKFGLVDVNGFLTFDGLDDCRKWENI